MAYKSFEETLPWQKVQDFIVEMYPALKDAQASWLVNELMTAAFSAASYIAKGHELGNNEEFVRYLNLAKDQLTKCRSMLIVAGRLKICKEADVSRFVEKNLEATKVIQGLIKYLKNNVKAA